MMIHHTNASLFASLIVTTRDRPDFLPIVLACCRRQTYSPLEIVIVDDGERFPVPTAVAAGAGALLIRGEPGTPLGTKLNLGIERASGAICLKIDDDDWYGPAYTETMIGRLTAGWEEGECAGLALAVPFLLFDLAVWEIRLFNEHQYAGATLCFRRQDWSEHPFPSVDRYEDVGFYTEQARRGVRPLAIAAPESFLAVRHRGAGRNRGHTWIDLSSSEPVEAHLRKRPLYERGPEKLLPFWALARYRRLHRQPRATSQGAITTDRGLLPRSTGLD